MRLTAFCLTLKVGIVQINSDNALALEALSKDPSLPANMRQGAKDRLFTERWTVRPQYLKQLEDSIKAQFLNSSAGEAQVRRLAALSPLAGVELISARVNLDGAAYLAQIHPSARQVVHWETFEYPNVERFIQNSALVTNVFGYWPTFHDAEVINLSLDRGLFEPEAQSFLMPFLIVSIEHWELTSEVNAKGYFVLRKRTISTLRFNEVDQLHLENFNHQNAIYGLTLNRLEEDGRTTFNVEFEGAHGIDATFQCGSIEVLTVRPLTEGKPIGVGRP